MDDLINRLPGGFLTLDHDSVIIYANKTLSTLLGYGQEQLPGMPVENLLSVPGKIFYQSHILPSLVLQGSVREMHFSAKNKQGQIVPLILNGNKTDAGGKTVYECLLTPTARRSDYESELLAARRAAEKVAKEERRLHALLREAHEAVSVHRQDLATRNEELEALRASLEEKVAGRTAELRKLVKDLEGLNYSIVHVLRAPIRNVIAIATMLSEDQPENLRPDQTALVSILKDGTLSLSSLLEDLLALSRLIVTPLKLKKNNFSTLALGIAKTVSAKWGGRAIECLVDKRVTVEADSSMLRMALTHLLDNACKYSPEGGPISLGGEVRDNQFWGYVRDKGIGIEAAYLNQIFLPFERLHNDDTFPGNGFGLAAVDRIVRRHFGQTWVESKFGDGATFYFTLPSESN